ncbi:MAG TPA: glucokinase [Parvibaculum sp.]|jgi:glucokinase
MNKDERLFLVADIGGTHARFALARLAGGKLEVEAPSVWLTALHQGLDVALEAFLEQKGKPALDAVAVCAAGPVQGAGPGARIDMTNCPWDVSAAALSRATGVAHPLLMNDFAALALAVPHLKPDELHRIGGGEADAAAPIAILGAGTGLGVASLVPSGKGRYIALPGEGGHVDLAPTNAREIALVYQLMQEFGRVSVERVLSGPGLVALYMAIGALDGTRDKARPTGVDVSNRARMGTSKAAQEAVTLFCGWLGATAGNLALTLGAKGGVYIGGGIVPGWIAEDGKGGKGGAPLFDAKLFRHRFEAKGRFKTYLAPIPVNVITREDPALMGLAWAAAEAS